MWFDKKNFKINELIFDKNIKGYVLPHASTKYTGNILSHSLRFQPVNYFDNIIILYYPAKNNKNVIIKDKSYYHEYYVIMKTMNYYTKKIWKYGKKNIKGINLRNTDINNINLKKIINFEKSLLIISADFSHYLNLDEAIKKENCAAHALMHRYFNQHLNCLNVVDIVDSFKVMYNNIPKEWNLQWIGRTRSSGIEGVGYLSFLIKQQHFPKNPNGIFVTAYDNNMQQRECLGEWFNSQNNYNKYIEENLIKKVIHLGEKYSRLTGGININSPIQHYTITYLYNDNKNTLNKNFIRGYHGIKYDAFFLPDVILENVYDNGKWISQEDKEWPSDNNFNIKETLQKLSSKYSNYSNYSKYSRYSRYKVSIKKNKNTKKNTNKKYKLYKTEIIHKTIY